MTGRTATVPAIWVGPFPAMHNGISEYFRSISDAWDEDGRPAAARLYFGDRRGYAMQVLRLSRLLLSMRRKTPRPIIHLQFCPFSTGPGALLIAQQAKALGLPLVTTIHEERSAVLTSREKGYWRLYPLAEERLLALSDAIVVHSRGQRDRLPDRWRDKAVVIEFGVDACPACHIAKDAPSPTVGCFGLIKPHKGLDMVVAACARAKAVVPDIGLCIVGTVPRVEKDEAYFAELRAYASRVLQENVTFVLDASASDFDANYHDVGVACFPLRQATQSTTFYRALRHTKPVIVTDVGAVAEVTARERLGIVVGVDDTAAMADAMVTLLRDHDRYGRYRESVRAYGKQRDWGAVARDHQMLYAQVGRR